MLFILNRQEKVINILKNYGNNSSLSPYFDDSLVEMLNTGAETFSFSTVAQGNLFKDLVVGNYVAFKKGQKYKLFQIVQVETRHDSEMIISVYCECAGLDLINKLFRARKINSCSLRKFIDTITEETGWNTGIIDATLLKTFDLDLEDDTVYATLQNNISKFEGEIEFRVELKNGQISNKFIDVYANRGKVTGKRFVFGKDIEGITRTVDSTSLYTALKGVGKNSLSFKGIEIEGIDKPVGQDFVADQEAYERYNNNGYHIMGLFEYDTESPEELLRETYKQLQKVKEPKVTYEIPIALLADLLGKDWEKVNIGDTVSIFDNAFNPPLMLMARVSQLETSETNPYANNCTFTNFIEVSSNITDEMRKLASKLEGYVDNNIQSKFPIGSSDIQDGAVGMDKISDIYTQTITTDILKAGKVETEKLIAKEAEITDAKIENLKAGTIEADKVIADSIVAVEGKFDKVTAGLVEADKVIADSIVAVEGKFDKVNAGLIEADKVIASLVEADKVIADTVKANKGEFDVLEAQVGEINNLISGNISSENIQTGGITGDNLNMATIFVDDANITNVNANKINAGTINTNNVHIESENGGIIIADNTQQFKDKNGKVRIQMGQDVQGNFNFGIYDEAGTGVLIDATGVKEKALADGVIKDRMIGQGEINGSKIDIDSLVSEVNKDSNTSVIKSSKVQLDTVGQTLDVAFNSLKSNVDNIQVGGRNLLLNSGFKNGMTYWEGHACNNVEVVSDSSAISGYATKFTSAGGGIYQRKSSGYYPHGTVLTVSGYVKCSVAGKSFDVNFENAGGSNTFKQIICTNENEWYYFTYTYTVDWNTFNTMTFYGQTGADYYLKDLKLEKGNKATDWTPAPEDIDSSIESVKQTTESNSTTINVMQGQISTAINNTQIVKDGKTTLLKDDYNKTVAKVDSINSTIGTHTTKINDLTGNITDVDTKVNSVQRDLEGTKSTVSNHSTSITDLNSKVTTQNSSISQLKDQIALKVEATDITNAIDNLKIGGKNLAFKEALAPFSISSLDLTDYVKRGDLTVRKPEGEYNGGFHFDKLVNYKKLTNYVVHFYMTCTEYTIKNIHFHNGQNIIKSDVYIDDIYVGTIAEIINTSIFNDGKTHKVRMEYTTPADLVDSSGGTNQTYFQPNKGISEPYTVFIQEFKVEEGNKATSWTPATEDIDNAITSIDSKVETTKNQVAEIVTNVDNITQRVSATENTTSTLNNNLNNLQVGGRNLCTGTKDWSDWGYGSNTTLTDEYYQGLRVYTSNNEWAYRYQDIELEANTDYTVSCWVKTNVAGTKVGCYIWHGDGEGIITLNEVDKWVRYTFTKTNLSKWTHRIRIESGNSINGAKLYLCGFKLEKGNKPTDWTPAPEDIDNVISNVNSKIENTTNKVSEIVTSLDSINLKVQSTEQTVTNHTTQLNQVDNKINNAIDNIKIGGRNIIKKKSQFTYGYLSRTDGYVFDVGHLNSNQDFYANEYFELKQGETIWLSLYKKDIQSNIECGVYIHIYNLNKVWLMCEWKEAPANTNLQVSYTATENCYVRFNSRGYEHYNHKAEYGTKATDYSPAPEDIDNSISNVNNKIESTANKVSEIVTSLDSINLKVQSNEHNVNTITSNFNNLQIGGRNLLLNSGFKKGMDYWNAHACTNIETMVDDTSLSGYMVKFTSTADGGLWQRKSSGYYPHGTVLTVSGYVKCSVEGKALDVNFENAGGSGTFKRITCTNQYTWYYFTFTYTVDWNSFSVVTFYGQTGADYYLKDLMLEYGNKASTWVEAPEDINNAISQVDSKVETTKNQVASIETNLSGITQRVESSEQTITNINSNKEDKKSRYIFARGTGNDYWANSYVEVEGKCITDGQGRGLRINVLNPITLEHLAREDYDTFADWNAINSFIRRINELNNGDYIIIVTSLDASYPWRCKDVLRSIGGNLLPDTEDTYREAYALIGRSRLGQGNGVEMYIPKTETDKRYAEVSVKVGVNGEFIGVNGSNVGSTITSLQSRISSAESKITPDAIINTVQNTISSAKNEAINSANSSTDSKLQNYATTSSLTQTANNLIAKFESSGGSNLIKNGAFKNGTAHWNIWGNPSAFHINHSENGYGHELRIVTNDKDQGAMQTIDHLRTGTAYTIACDVWVESGNCIMYVVDDSHWYLSSISSGTGWNKLSITFTPTSSSVSVRIGRGTEGSNGDYRFTAIRMYMGNVVEAWTPHHSESYDGIIKLDSNGIEVSHTGANTTTHMNSKGFFIYNSQGETVGSLATETGLSVVNANKVYAGNIRNIYEGDGTLYVNHNYTGDSDGSSSKPFKSFGDLQAYLQETPIINKDVTVNIVTTSEITEPLVMDNLSGRGTLKFQYSKTCIHRTNNSAMWCINMANINLPLQIHGGRTSYNTNDGAILCDVGNQHAIKLQNCPNFHIGSIAINCKNWGIWLSNCQGTTFNVDFCKTYCAFELRDRSHVYDSDACGNCGDFFRVYSGSIFVYGSNGGGYRPFGNKLEYSGRYLLVGGERNQTNSFRTPPPKPTTSDQYGTWSMKDYGYFTYGRNGINVNSWNPSSKRIQQGEWSGYGNNYGFAFFDDAGIRSWLSNGTPKDGSTITLKRASSGGYSSSQPVYLCGATNTSCSGTPAGIKSYGNIGSLAWGETKTFNIPTSFVNDLKSGAIKSVCFYDSSGASYVKIDSVSIKLKANKPV